jgi:prepilin-type N-terminal cleavage/methylation domain-containing protein
MLNTRLLLCRAARQSRGGFTLVELLVVIGIIAILAGVALGPITNGIKQAKHNAAMQTGRQIGQMEFSYATDNTANGNAYPSDSTGFAIAQDLINAGYATDPSVFVVSGQTGIATYAGASPIVLTNANCSWSFTCVALTAPTISPPGGITSSASDLTPLVFFNNGPATSLTTPFPATPGTAKTVTLTVACPFGTDGIAVFYKGNNATYLKAGTAGVVGVVSNFISSNDTDTTTYLIAP